MISSYELEPFRKGLQRFDGVDQSLQRLSVVDLNFGDLFDPRGILFLEYSQLSEFRLECSDPLGNRLEFIGSDDDHG